MKCSNKNGKLVCHLFYSNATKSIKLILCSVQATYLNNFRLIESFNRFKQLTS